MSLAKTVCYVNKTFGPGLKNYILFGQKMWGFGQKARKEKLLFWPKDRRERELEREREREGNIDWSKMKLF